MKIQYPRIVLHPGKETSLLRQHPWIFSGAIRSKEHGIVSGDVVWICNSKGNILGTGFYSDGSIAVRLLSFCETELNPSFWFQAMDQAISNREHWGLFNSQLNVYRLFYGEGDGIPGLVIDYYNGHVVLQLHHKGLLPYLNSICKALQERLQEKLKSIYFKSAALYPAADKAGVPADGLLFGDDLNPVWVNENNHRFLVDRVSGQKTGFFIDQRENRSLVQKYASGRNVLNAFSYTGGFSVYAAAGGAQSVCSIDISAAALETCKLNFNANALEQGTFIKADVFEVLKESVSQHNLIILDPPAFAKHRTSKHQAVTAYKRINSIALKHAPKNSLLFTFSCSGVVDRNLFYNTLVASAIEAKRNVQWVQMLMQGIDHPVSPCFPEGDYLKGLMIWIKD